MTFLRSFEFQSLPRLRPRICFKIRDVPSRRGSQPPAPGPRSIPTGPRVGLLAQLPTIMSSAVTSLDSALSTLIPYLKTETTVLDRLLYKNKNQHRRGTYYQRLMEVRRFTRRLSFVSLTQHIQTYSSKNGNKSTVKLVQDLERHGTQLALSLVAIYKLSRPLLVLMSQTYFLPFVLTALSLVSRIYAIYKTLLLRCVQAFEDLSEGTENSSGSGLERALSSGKELAWLLNLKKVDKGFLSVLTRSVDDDDWGILSGASLPDLGSVQEVGYEHFTSLSLSRPYAHTMHCPVRTLFVKTNHFAYCIQVIERKKHIDIPPDSDVQKLGAPRLDNFSRGRTASSGAASPTPSTSSEELTQMPKITPLASTFDLLSGIAAPINDADSLEDITINGCEGSDIEDIFGKMKDGSGNEWEDSEDESTICAVAAVSDAGNELNVNQKGAAIPTAGSGVAKKKNKKKKSAKSIGVAATTLKRKTVEGGLSQRTISKKKKTKKKKSIQKTKNAEFIALPTLAFSCYISPS